MPETAYTTIWRNKFLTSEAKSLDEMITSLQEAADQLKAMKKDGVVLDPESGIADDYAMLVTTDAKVAEKYQFEEDDGEAEEFDDDEE